MLDSLAAFLDGVSTKVFWFAVTCFVVINGAALAAFAVSRSRRLVDEWTPKLVAVDAMVLGAGLGIPLVSTLAKLGVNAISAMLGGGTVAPE